jgi:hypothetical protein
MVNLRIEEVEPYVAPAVAVERNHRRAEKPKDEAGSLMKVWIGGVAIM